MDEGEAWALLRSMQWAVQLGYQRVIFEIDCSHVVMAVNSNTPFRTEFGALIQACRIGLAANVDYSVCLVRRAANEAADCISRVARTYDNPTTWDELNGNKVTTLAHYLLPK